MTSFMSRNNLWAMSELFDVKRWGHPTVISGVHAPGEELLQHVLSWFLFGLALVFFVRAMGDFCLVGFFKKVTGTRFARRDSTVFSTLCLAMAIGILSLDAPIE
ncbi:MAG: DUF3995 domain-containing protein [Acidithiobacillus ferrivorans]